MGAGAEVDPITYARGGTITLNGDLMAVGGYYVGDAARGLGGYIEVQSPSLLSADRVGSTGDTT
ncbi:hypothetical protein JZU57_01440, partial [bacterium]|nr:hypothetical protein [bacterium]